MRDIVATAPSAGPSDPRHNGHHSTLLIDELGTFDPRLAPRNTETDPTLDHPTCTQPPTQASTRSRAGSTP